MAEDLQAMLNTIGEKFDMSFDQKQDLNVEVELQNHQRSINPENSSNQILTTQVEDHSSTEGERIECISDRPDQPRVSPSQEEETNNRDSHLDVPFLPLLEKEDYEANEQEQANEKQPLIEGQTAGHFESEQEEMEYYRSLSEKFQDALNKVHSRKSFTCFEGEFIERQKHYQKKKQTGMSLLLLEKQRRETRHVRGKPLINSYSQQILPHYTPIDKRYPAVLAEKKRKVESWQAEYRRKKEQAKEEEIKQMERWAEIVKERVGEVRSKEEYFEDQLKWSEKRYKNIEERAKKQDQSLRAEVSFKPKINQRSDNMMKKKPDRVPVYEKEPELKKLPIDENCTFKPNLVKTLKK